MKAGCVGSGCRRAEQPGKLKRRNRVSRLGGLIDCDVMRDDQPYSAITSLPAFPPAAAAAAAATIPHGPTIRLVLLDSVEGDRERNTQYNSDKAKPIRSVARPRWSSTDFYHQCAECIRHPFDHFGTLGLDLQPFLSWFCMDVCIFSCTGSRMDLQESSGPHTTQALSVTLMQ